MSESSLFPFITSLVAVIFAVTIHEFCHAWMATYLGDPTARVLGRLSLNPLRHFDFFGTLALIFIGIGWGKPVPFNEQNLRNPKRDSALIAAAGPLSNLLTALILAIPLKYLSATSFKDLPLYDLLSSLFAISILLFSLNVLPLPPFDGSKIIGLLVPRRLQRSYDTFLKEGVTWVIIFVLFDVMVLQKTTGVSVLHLVVSKISTWVIALISLGT